MRYLLHRNQRGELTARQKYLYGVFKMYFLPDNPEGSYIPLIPLGESDPNLLFITGHTPQIENHLKEYLDFIPEDNIIITSCFGEIFKKFTGQKTFIFPNSLRISALSEMAKSTALILRFQMWNLIFIMSGEILGIVFIRYTRCFDLRRNK